MRRILVLAGLATTFASAAQSYDGSCRGLDTVTAIELKMCVDLAKGANSRDAKVARKLIENGNASWSSSSENGTCRMSVNASGTIRGNSQSVRATCTVSDPKALRKCVEKARYATDVTRCGLQHLTK